MLEWPGERIEPDKRLPRWQSPGTNICLDFHGDPTAADLAILSDGNHHMALKEVMETFSKAHPKAGLFYATTPPGPLLKIMEHGGILLGNLAIRVRPHVFISPPHVLDRLKDMGRVKRHRRLASSRGSVLLVPKNNPENICDIPDLKAKNLTLFISNPRTEKVSFTGYARTVNSLAKEELIPDDLDDAKDAGGPLRLMTGNAVHHREGPEAVAEGQADAAILYYHLALRFKRIFPDFFDLVPLGGTIEDPNPLPGNRISHIHAGLVDTPGPWGRLFLEHLFSKGTKQIYQYHGLAASGSGE